MVATWRVLLISAGMLQFALDEREVVLGGRDAGGGVLREELSAEWTPFGFAACAEGSQPRWTIIP